MVTGKTLGEEIDHQDRYQQLSNLYILDRDVSPSRSVYAVLFLAAAKRHLSSME